MPSISELKKLYKQKSVVGGGFDEGYWSSTEKSTNEAWVQNFDTGESITTGKDVQLYVPAIKAF
ncbi:MAG: hypothetical protein ABJA79_02480 [Parafilimonas sp.]